MDLVRMSPLYPLYVSRLTILAPSMIPVLYQCQEPRRASCTVPEFRPDQEMRNHVTDGF